MVVSFVQQNLTGSVRIMELRDIKQLHTLHSKMEL